MAKDDQKLRAGLANLFKAQRELQLERKPNQSSNSIKRRRGNLNGKTSKHDSKMPRLSENLGEPNILPDKGKKLPRKKQHPRSECDDYLNRLSDDQIDVVESEEFQKPRGKNKLKIEQGKGPLAPNYVPSQKETSGKVNGKTKKQHFIKRPKLSESHKGVSGYSSLQDKTKKKSQKKHQQLPRSEGGESKKEVGNYKNSVEDFNKDDKPANKNVNATKKSKQKVEQNRRERDTCPESESQKGISNEPIEINRKRTTMSDSRNASSKQSKIISKKKESTHRNSYDSMDESDHDSDSDDTYEFSDDDDYDSEDYYYDDDSSDDCQASTCDYDGFEDDFLYGSDSDSDQDYELPREEVADLIIHKGLAVKYDLESHHGAEFDESVEESHIVELANQEPIKIVKQHEAYSVEQLRALEVDFCQQMSELSVQKKTEEDECPQLVLIDKNNEGFKRSTSGIVMDDEVFSDSDLVEDSEESSVTSFTDLSRKYLQEQGYFDDCYMEEELEDEHDNEEISMQAVIVAPEGPRTDDGDGSEDVKFLNISLEEEETEPCLVDIINSATDQSMDVRIIEAKMENFDQKRARKRKANDAQNVVAQEDSIGEYLASQLNDDFIAERDEDGTTHSIEGNDSFEVKPEEAIKGAKKNCKLRSIFCNSMDSYYVLVLMKSPFFIYGTVNAKLIAGSTEIYGYKLKCNEMVTVHSPRGCCAIPFQPTLSSYDDIGKERIEATIISEIKSLKDLAEFNSREIRDLLSAYDPPNDAILLLTRNETADKIKHIFQQHINENIFPPHIPLSRPLFSSEIMLDCMLNSSHEHALEIPTQWLDIHLKENSKLMLVGGKSVGKSTFLRYLLNRHLGEFPQILLVDLDIGQPETFLPQTVSCTLLNTPLLGPGFFYQHEPDKAYAVGHTNITLCAHAYMRAVIKLLKFCKSHSAYANVPWLINTMGYNRGFGGELISVICSHLQPTDIIQLQSNKPINNFDMLFEPGVVANMPRIIYNEPEFECSTRQNYQPSHALHIMTSAVLQQSRYQQEWQMSAKDLRYVMQLSRLSSILPDEGEWINQSETFAHNLEKLKIVNLVAPKADPLETLKSLENNLVYLCHVEIPSCNDVEDLQTTLPPLCLGFGIVRAIDYQANQVFILPAMPLEKLTYINCLALGEMPLPSSLLTEQNPESKLNVPFVQVMNNEATSRAVKQFFYRT